MKVKICGISDSNTLKYIINHPYPPEYIGFIVNYKKSKRFVKFNDLKKLLKIKRKKSKYVAVLVKPTDKELKKNCNIAIWLLSNLWFKKWWNKIY